MPIPRPARPVTRRARAKRRPTRSPRRNPRASPPHRRRRRAPTKRRASRRPPDRRGPLLLSAPVETIVVDGLALAQDIRKEISEAVGRHVAAGRRAPVLAVVRVGDDPASASYIKGKRRACESVGIESTETHLLERSTPVELDAMIAELNGTQHVDGILIQLPLPRQFD